MCRQRGTNHERHYDLLHSYARPRLAVSDMCGRSENSNMSRESVSEYSFWPVEGPELTEDDVRRERNWIYAIVGGLCCLIIVVWIAYLTRWEL